MAMMPDPGRYLNSPDVEAECAEIDAQLSALDARLDPHTCDGDDCGHPLSHGTTVGLSYAATKALLVRLKARPADDRPNPTHPLHEHQVKRAREAATEHLSRALGLQDGLAYAHRHLHEWTGIAVINNQDFIATRHIEMRAHVDALAMETAWLVRHA